MAAQSTTRQSSTTTTKTTAAKRSTAAKKAAQTRSAAARKRSTAAKKAAQTRADNARTPVDYVADYAEKAVLVPLGASLVARDRVIDAVTDLRDSYSSREKAERELKARQRRLETDIRRFERRGTTARNRFEREVRKTRTRVERTLRQRRTRLERDLKAFRRDLDKQATSTRKNVELAGRVRLRARREPRCDDPAARPERRLAPAALPRPRPEERGRSACRPHICAGRKQYLSSLACGPLLGVGHRSFGAAEAARRGVSRFGRGAGGVGPETSNSS